MVKCLLCTTILAIDFISWYEKRWTISRPFFFLSYNNVIRTHRSPAGRDSHTCAGWRVFSGLRGSDSARCLKRTGSGSSCRSAWTGLLRHSVEKHETLAPLSWEHEMCTATCGTNIPCSMEGKQSAGFHSNLKLNTLMIPPFSRGDELISLCVYMHTKNTFCREIWLWRKHICMQRTPGYSNICVRLIWMKTSRELALG